MDKQTENMVREILIALEEGTAIGKKKVINSAKAPDVIDLLLSSCEVVAGYIAMAVIEVIKKYTEGEG